MGEEEREKLCLRWDREWVLDEVSTKLCLERLAGFCQEAKHCPSSNPLSSNFTVCVCLFFFLLPSDYIFHHIFFFFYLDFSTESAREPGMHLGASRKWKIMEMNCTVGFVSGCWQSTLEATIKAKHLLKLLSIRQTRCNQVKGYRPWAKQQRKKPSVEIIF